MYVVLNNSHVGLYRVGDNYDGHYEGGYCVLKCADLFVLLLGEAFLCEIKLDSSWH